jgi:mannosylfructose-phosphate synthase
MISLHGCMSTEPPYGERDTGAQVLYVLELSRRLVQHGYEVDIWTRQFDDQPVVEAVEDHVRIVRAPCDGNQFIRKEELFKHVREWRENALKMIERAGVSYSFVNSHYWLGGVAGGFLGTALRAPHIHTPHSLGIWKQRELLADSPDAAAEIEAKYDLGTRTRTEQRVYCDASLVIATTPVQTDVLKLDYGVDADKLRVIPAGYDDERFYPVGPANRDALRSRLGYEGKAIVSFGRPRERDGYDLLLLAFAEVAARDTSARLHLVIGETSGNIDQMRVIRNCEELAKVLGVDRHVRFERCASDDEVADHFRAADLFVLPSRYEPLGVRAVEAMACGTPVVVTTHGGLFRMLRFGVDGLFADPFEPDDFGTTILKALRHPRLAERLAQNGAETARSYFAWASVTQQLVAAMEDRPSAGLELADLEPSADWVGPDDQSPTDAIGYRS